MGFLHALPYPIAILGTVVVVVLAFLTNKAGIRFINSHPGDPKEHYRKRQMLSTAVLVIAAIVIAILWVRLFQNTSTFVGIVGAGLAIALREPLLSVAGRVAIFAGHIYAVGDRIEINKMSGDVIDVGFFYTRMMEIGNWIKGDQYSGRIVQFANAQIFGAAVFNYTRNFAYIWDEIGLPITYPSNIEAATEIMSKAGDEYTQEYMQGAQRSVEQMRRYFLVSSFELRPQVYLNFDSNYVTLTMRYLVDPKQRRSARNFLFTRILNRVQQRQDISFGSETMDVAVTPGEVAEWKQALGLGKTDRDGQKAA